MKNAKRAGIYVNLWNRGENGVSYGPFKYVHSDDGLMTGYKFSGQVLEEKICSSQREESRGPLKWRACDSDSLYTDMTIKIMWENL